MDDDRLYKCRACGDMSQYDELRPSQQRKVERRANAAIRCSRCIATQNGQIEAAKIVLPSAQLKQRDGVPKVYFARQIAGPIKIGFTADSPLTRIAQLQTACPVRLLLLGVLLGDEGVEKALHRRFELDRLVGEWFNPSSRVLDFIAQCSMPYPEFLKQHGWRAEPTHAVSV